MNKECKEIIENKLKSCNIKYELNDSECYGILKTELTGDYTLVVIEYTKDKNITVRPYGISVDTQGWGYEIKDEYQSLSYEKINTGLTDKNFKNRLIGVNTYFKRIEDLKRKGEEYIKQEKTRICEELKRYHEIGMHINTKSNLTSIDFYDFVANPKYTQWTEFELSYKYGPNYSDNFVLTYTNGSIKVNRLDFNSSNKFDIVNALIKAFTSIKKTNMKTGE